MQEIQFRCDASGTIAMLHGFGLTELADGVSRYPEADSGSETLDIQCVDLPPTPTPTATPLPPTPVEVGGFSRDPDVGAPGGDGPAAPLAALASGAALALGGAGWFARRRARR